MYRLDMSYCRHSIVMEAKPLGERITYKVVWDARGAYLQMFKPNTSKLLKLLLIPQEMLPTAQAGEA